MGSYGTKRSALGTLICFVSIYKCQTVNSGSEAIRFRVFYSRRIQVRVLDGRPEWPQAETQVVTDQRKSGTNTNPVQV